MKRRNYPGLTPLVQRKGGEDGKERESGYIDYKKRKGGIEK
jgi:hypothetical protein